MGDRPGEAEKTRISVTLTRPYLDALDRLVEEKTGEEPGGGDNHG